ncbi:P-loop containing nucleoside triphosphate hydrolase protein [Blakeslea trispora]|nr:P-loop containing nucleoside triphosphate hydrolase protein [Blakeslea trispora]
MAPPENKLHNIYHSHGIDVYHKPTIYQPSDNGFNLQKLAWVESDDDTFEPFKRARIMFECEDDDNVLVEHEEDSREEYVHRDMVHMMNPPKFDHVEDMAELLYMHEPAVVHTLTQRYKQNEIYTYSGLFLVAINPYRQLPIYSKEMIRSYRKKRRGEVPPHIYAIADHAFHDMLHDRQNQSILITGESGAGKTENTKIVIQYLTSITSSHSNTKRKTLESQILQANPILESFGNAQTIRNNNSSRFGKFIRIAFNRNGDIEGAFIDWYLLETSRVHTQSPEERNYHIFYELMNADAEMKASLKIDQCCPADFQYTRNANHTIQGVDDASEYKKLVHAMDIMGISPEERLEFFRIIVAVLYLGNIIITNSYGGRVDISNYEVACELLGVPPVLFKKHLLEPQIRAGNEWVSQSKSPTQVKDNLDALAKVLYERNFGQIVRRVNSAIDGGPFFQSLLEEKKDLDGDERYIGVLDIAGFEIFKINSFEQLCINYTNEKLQDFFNQTMFVLEEKEYQREHIQWNESLDYRHDLQPTIQLIESPKNPIGILSCLEDECVTQGTDERLLAKICEQNRNNPRFKRDIYNEGFAIKHYAGEVKYSTSGWVERGKDPLNEHVARLFAESTNQHVATLFKDYAVPAPSSSSSRSSDILLRNKTSFPLHYRTRKGGGNFHTVGYKHKQQLSVLMNTLQNTRPHFVRCILPNDRKRPGEIQPRLILHQLRCNGVLEGIRICRVGYPNRVVFQQFREQYKLLAPDLIQHERDHRKACQLLLSTVSEHFSYGEHFQMGRTKVFFKAGILGELEKMRDIQLSFTITKVQAACLGWMARRKRVERESQDKLIRTIQRNARIYVDMMQSRLWKVYYRRKELQYTFGAENAVSKKIDDLEQVLAVSQDQLRELSEENQQQQKMVENLEEERNALRLRIEELEQDLERTNQRLRQTESELQTTKQFSDEQAIMLSKMHKDVLEEAEENEHLTSQYDLLSKENQKLQESIESIKNDKSAYDTLQTEIDAKDDENRQLQDRLRLAEEQHQDKLNEKEQEMNTLEKELKELRQKIMQYESQMQEKVTAYSAMQEQFYTIEASLSRETEEKETFQKRNLQLEKDIDVLTRLVQNEAKESRARADKFDNLVASLLKRSATSLI